MTRATQEGLPPSAPLRRTPRYFVKGSTLAPVAAALAVGVALSASDRAAAQNNIVQNQIPDFYQHQGDNDSLRPDGTTITSATPSTAAIWSPDRGWCAFVSDMDALYPWEALTIAGVHPFDNADVALFGAPGGGTGAALTSAGSWLDTADDTVIPQLITGIGGGTINNYLKKQKVDPGSLGLFGLVDTQYRTLVSGQVQVATVAGWKNVTPNTFQLYQQLTSTGQYLPAALQPLAAITTTIRLNYAGANNRGTTGFWWGFHQVAGAGVAGANTIQYSDPDAIPINAGNRNGGFTQAAINANEYDNLYPDESLGAPPIPGNSFLGGSYATGDLYSTMRINAMGQVTGGNGPYATGLKGAAAPVTRITNIDAVSLIGAQIVNVIVKPLYDAVTFLFSGNFGGDVSKVEIFANSPLYAANLGLSETDPDWSIAQVMTDPFGNSWASTDGGILLSEGAGGAALMEDGADYSFTEDTTGGVTAFTLFAYDQSDGYWLTETYGANVGFGDGPQAIPEAPTWLLILLGFGGAGLIARRQRRPQTRDATGAKNSRGVSSIMFDSMHVQRALDNLAPPRAGQQAPAPMRRTWRRHYGPRR